MCLIVSLFPTVQKRSYEAYPKLFQKEEDNKVDQSMWSRSISNLIGVDGFHLTDYNGGAGHPLEEFPHSRWEVF